jgi:hypothetical protein
LKGHSLFCDASRCNAYQKPKLPIFSGEEKSETSFDVWKLEVKCVLREGDYTGSSVLQAIRGSLKGKARSLLLSLSEHATAALSPDQYIDLSIWFFATILISPFSTAD